MLIKENSNLSTVNKKKAVLIKKSYIVEIIIKRKKYPLIIKRTLLIKGRNFPLLRFEIHARVGRCPCEMINILRRLRSRIVIHD